MELGVVLTRGLSVIDEDSEFGTWYNQSANVNAFQKTEVDQYLEEPIYQRKEHFNILTWRQMNSGKFPTLANIDWDVLDIPSTTISFESAFSIGGRVIDETRASLLPEIVEALVTTADWIESQKTSSK